MAKADLKTKKSNRSVAAFLNAIENAERRRDAKAVTKLMQDVTGKQPRMWGSSIVGFGEYHYAYASGREGDFFMTGFAPRKQNLTIYIMPGYQDYGDLLKKIGPHTLGKSCLYLKHLDDIHLPTLKKLIRRGVADLKKKYPTK